MNLPAIQAGCFAFRAGRIPRDFFAPPSSPMEERIAPVRAT